MSTAAAAAAASSNGGQTEGGKEEAELTQAVDRFFDLLQVCGGESGQGRKKGRRDDGCVFDREGADCQSIFV